MGDLSYELTRLAGAIVRGETVSAQLDSGYPNYSLATAIGVYRNNYCGNLHDALAGAYPVIRQLVGEEFFRFMARKYVERHASVSANLYHYGEHLAGFLAAFSPAQELVYLPDVARLEWACHTAYFASDEAVLELDRLAAVPAGHCPDLLLATACQVVRSDYPLTAIWLAHQPDAGCDFHIDLAQGGSIALVSRLADVVLVSELSQAAADWLQHIQDGATLGVATAEALARHPDFDLQATLLVLVAQAALTGFK